MERGSGRYLAPWRALLIAGACGAAFAAAAQEEPAAETPPPTETAPAAPTPTVPVGEADAAPAESDATQLDTIEVTASKRIKSQRDIPGSVGAIRGEDLERMKAQGLSDYLKLVPGVTLTDYGSSESIPVIRGIAASTSGIGTQFTPLTTGIYLDEMSFSDIFAPLSVPDLNAFDLERVEVLKGPQGTLFGSGALAGAIRYIVQKPKPGIWETKVSVTQTRTRLSNDESQIGALALNAPLGDNAGLRLVGVYRDEAGLYDSRPGGDDPATPTQEGNTRNEEDVDSLLQKTGRILVGWQPTDRLQLGALYFRQDTDQPDDGVANNPERPETTDTPFAAPQAFGIEGVNLSAAYEFDWGRLFYSGNMQEKTSFTRGRFERALGLGNQEALAFYNQIIGNIDVVGNELRFSSLEGGDSAWEWLVGASYFTYDQLLFQFAPTPAPPGTGYYANPPDDAEDVPTQDRATSFLWAKVVGDGKETAVFGEASRRLGEHWEATLGARVFETDLVSDGRLSGAQIVALSGETETRNVSHVNERGVNPKASLRYLHDRNIQAYVLAAKGFQFGGFQLNPPLLGVDQATERRGFHFGPYKSSDLWNYELGLRTEWLDRRLRFDLAFFYMDWTDLQLTLAIPVNPVGIPAPPGSGIPEDVTLGVIVNVARAHSEGVEAMLQLALTSSLSLTTSAAWISALTDEPFDEDHADGPVPAGTRLPGTPRFQMANVVSYETALPYFDAWESALALVHSHVGEHPNSIRANGMNGGYDTLDVRWSLVKRDSPFVPELTLAMNNLTDVRGLVASDTGSPGSYFFLRPRTTLLSLSWKY